MQTFVINLEKEEELASEASGVSPGDDIIIRCKVKNKTDSMIELRPVDFEVKARKEDEDETDESEEGDADGKYEEAEGVS